MSILFKQRYFVALVLILFHLVPLQLSADALTHDDALRIESVITHTNDARSAAGVVELLHNDFIQSAAQKKAELMAGREDFSHTLLDGTTAWQLISETGYAYRLAGENLAVHFVDEADLHSAWMESQAHRANILDKEFVHIGVGMASGVWQEHRGVFFVQLFATPLTE